MSDILVFVQRSRMVVYSLFRTDTHVRVLSTLHARAMYRGNKQDLSSERSLRGVRRSLSEECGELWEEGEGWGCGPEHAEKTIERPWKDSAVLSMQDVLKYCSSGTLAVGIILSINKFEIVMVSRYLRPKRAVSREM